MVFDRSKRILLSGATIIKFFQSSFVPEESTNSGGNKNSESPLCSDVSSSRNKSNKDSKKKQICIDVWKLHRAIKLHLLPESPEYAKKMEDIDEYINREGEKSLIKYKSNMALVTQSKKDVRECIDNVALRSHGRFEKDCLWSPEQLETLRYCLSQFNHSSLGKMVEEFCFVERAYMRSSEIFRKAVSEFFLKLWQAYSKVILEGISKRDIGDVPELPLADKESLDLLKSKIALHLENENHIMSNSHISKETRDLLSATIQSTKGRIDEITKLLRLNFRKTNNLLSMLEELKSDGEEVERFFLQPLTDSTTSEFWNEFGTQLKHYSAVSNIYEQWFIINTAAREGISKQELPKEELPKRDRTSELAEAFKKMEEKIKEFNKLSVEENIDVVQQN